MSKLLKRIKNDRRNGEKLVSTSVEKRKDGKKRKRGNRGSAACSRQIDVAGQGWKWEAGDNSFTQFGLQRWGEENEKRW